MAILALTTSPEITKEIYDNLRKELNWERNPAPGCLIHSAAFGDGGMHVADIWASEQDHTNFVKTRLMGAFQKFNIGQPKTEIYPIHNVNLFAPAEKFKIAQA
jgi:hypothetical protein